MTYAQPIKTTSHGLNRPRVAVLIPEEVRGRIFPDTVTKALSEFAEPVFYADDELRDQDIAPALSGITAVITGWQSPKLPLDSLAPRGSVQIISHAAGSVIRLGVKEALERGEIRVSHSAPVIGEAVAEFTLAQILAHLRRHRDTDAAMRRGEGWLQVKQSYLGQLLSAQKVGIVGLGYVGRMVLDLLKPFRCEVMVFDPYVSETEADGLGVISCDLETLFRECSVVSLHAPNIEATNGMITKSLLDLMAEGALLVNNARAGLLEKGALLETLDAGRIFAAIDVFDVEPLPEGDRIFDLPNVYLSPHSAGHTHESYVRQGLSAVEDVRRFFTGERLLQEIPPERAATMA
ncbi:hydroxyacid dehydrogenase [Amaricoccus macauensis]|uniref:hydroxyacid dehydrogenase n=1 Tax=Amaricoccus macauensis TaxID=57001 RepID=UPI003C7AB461